MFMRLHLNGKKVAVMAHACYFSYGKAYIKRIMVQTSLGKKQDPISKITKASKCRGMLQVVECLPTKHEVLNSNLSP
jgi:hypothetical protein